ncbi:hypothetical protein P3T20_004892 [Paraburkholderia sp. GAS206C]|uniref:DUF6496 domain-containing protein n=1 Tax=unclassified Paraburkholderia TaxID=2615204 RepID=UPI003D1D001D
MPEQKTIHRAHADKRAGKASSTQAGEFVKEEVDRVRAGKHGVKSAKQAIAIGLSKARRAGVDLKAPKKGTTSEATRKKAAKDNAAGQHKTAAKSASTETKAKRARAATTALKRESGRGASSAAMSKQAKSSAARRPAASRSAAAKKAVATKGTAGRSAAAKKAAHTRAARSHH